MCSTSLVSTLFSIFRNGLTYGAMVLDEVSRRHQIADAGEAGEAEDSYWSLMGQIGVSVPMQALYYGYMKDGVVNR